MKRRTRVWLIALGALFSLIGALGWSGVRALNPPAGPAAAPVQTALGLIRGTREAGLTVYRGIPYAAPPVGELRWRPPTPASWQGTLDASHFMPACMQVGGTLPGSPARSEDCLGLNIWTPAVRADEKRAVMVFVHGGGFTNASSDLRFWWGESLARRGVVVVSLNYRLGVLGFLAHPELTAESEHHASGNYALLDCIAALKWVRDNIDAFGGDPGNVTLFGQSAGSFLASELMASPLARGLFVRVIGMSGADIGEAGTPAGIPLKAHAEEAGVAFAKAMGATSIASLRQLPAQALMEHAGGVLDTPQINLPNVDGYVVPQQVDVALGSAAKTDLLVGIDAVEGGTPSASELAAWRAFTWARIHAKSSSGRTYAYVFSREPPWSDAAGHGTDLPYLFGFPRAVFYVLPWRTKRDLAISKEMQTYWTNFAKTGDPNGEGLPAWQSLGGTEFVLNLGDSTRMEQMPR